ncbi:universal stress protein [Baekduia soli]|uniref:Universal stress protein n=1 Tax=Baekduia soli TaxID=496014 RepID=A0A5B8U9F5_9ACTN|nr:universal stress protein [Baekduia soli]QEC49799.1 universal stress protein [Baekduia soli]
MIGGCPPPGPGRTFGIHRPKEITEMYEHVIAGFDGHDGGRDAIVLAAALKPGRITIVSAYGPATSMSPLATNAFWEALHDEATKNLEAARAAIGVDAELLAVSDTSPARALHESAESAGADLIVLGSAHHGRLGRMVLGDVGRSVVHGAPCPVAIAPRRFRDTSWTPGRIAVGYDGGPEAGQALEAATGLARSLGAELLIVTAWTPTTMAATYAALPGVTEIAAEDEANAQKILDEAVAGAGVPAEGRLVAGAPGPALAKAADEVDLVVVGSRGWGSARRVLSGSTSDYLVHHATTPVVVIPRPAAAEEATTAPTGPRAGAVTP